MLRIRQSLAMLAVGALALTAACSYESDVPLTPEIVPPYQEEGLGCNGACHGDAYSVAPPKALNNAVNTTDPGVGAHRSHLKAAPTWYAKLECSDCHRVPAKADDPYHIDGDNVAELYWSPRATYNGALTPVYNGESCSNVYCHGYSLEGGNLTTPNWTYVNGTQAACGNCHGAPPPPPHAQDVDCGKCHTTIQPGTAPNYVFLDPASHINGKIDTAPPDDQPCNSCHGGPQNSAPPVDLSGYNTYNYRGVGAHQAHLGPSDWRREIFCAQCHRVPVAVADPYHIDGDNRAEFYPDGLNPYAVYNYEAYTCNNAYCHSDGWYAYKEMTWTENLDLGCTSCHEQGGNTMSGKHDKHVNVRGYGCNECHYTVIDANKNFLRPDYHIDGVHQVYFNPATAGANGAWDAANRTCVNVACHNVDRQWD
jgi:predicted CxxxxCH...CXXCH cytochrome family protein